MRGHPRFTDLGGTGNLETDRSTTPLEMKTPQTKTRPQRMHTPKMSERKKALFSSSRRSPIKEDSDDGELKGIDILTPVKNSTSENRYMRMTRSSMKKFSEDLIVLLESETSDSSPKEKSSVHDVSFDSALSSETNISDLSEKAKGNLSETYQIATSSEDLGDLLKDTLNLKHSKLNSLENERSNKCSVHIKRAIDSEKGSSPRRKQIKLDENTAETRQKEGQGKVLTSPINNISTSSFYSKCNENALKISRGVSQSRIQKRTCNKTKNRSHPTIKTVKLFNKGVVHKIKRVKSSAIPIERILQSIKSAKLRSLSTKFLPKEKVEQVHEILRTTKNPIELARPLQIEQIGNDSADEDTDIEEENNKCVATQTNRKFFKSRISTIRNQFHVMGNIDATVRNGKIHILPSKKKRNFDPDAFTSFEESFTTEQQTINKIIEDLDESHNGSKCTNVNIASEDSKVNQNDDDIPLIDPFIEDDGEFALFRNRIPYNTHDDELIERQHLLLDFLIQNNMCTEENFKIFIADPDNHKKEAASILDSIPIVVTSNNNDIIVDQDYERTDVSFSVDQIESLEKIIEDQSVLAAAMSQPNPTCDQNQSTNNQLKLFPIFYKKFRQLPEQTKRKSKRRRVEGTGLNQFQIDAGQKNFGARQCPDCGLMYTVHEPEEERLHATFHHSVDILKFQGWIDEDLVKEIFDWGIRGRIICVSSWSHAKHQQRVRNILSVVDKETGFSATTLPAQYNAYIAANRNSIIGLCLVEPIQNANRYLVIDGIECCSEETYDVKCGILRIWVSPFKRRAKIATTLVQTIRTRWIPGCKLEMDDIAFSPPTDDGRIFAQRISNRKDFLLYT